MSAKASRRQCAPDGDGSEEQDGGHVVEEGRHDGAEDAQHRDERPRLAARQHERLQAQHTAIAQTCRFGTFSKNILLYTCVDRSGTVLQSVWVLGLTGGGPENHDRNTRSIKVDVGRFFQGSSGTQKESIRLWPDHDPRTCAARTLRTLRAIQSKTPVSTKMETTIIIPKSSTSVS